MLQITRDHCANIFQFRGTKTPELPIKKAVFGRLQMLMRPAALRCRVRQFCRFEARHLPAILNLLSAANQRYGIQYPSNYF